MKTLEQKITEFKSQDGPVLTALTVALAIPIVGVLLISTLMVIPVVAALQLKRSFKQTLLIAEGFSVFSMIFWLFSAFYLNLSAGGKIVMVTLLLVGLIMIKQQWFHGTITAQDLP